MYPRTTHSIGSGFGAAHQHGAAFQRRGVLREFAGEIFRRNHMIGNDVGQLLKPEQRKLRENAPLSGIGVGSTTSNAESRSVATMSSRSPNS